MNIDELKTYSELFYDSYRIPICCYDSQIQFQAFYPLDISLNIFNNIASKLYNQGLNMSFITDQQFLYWGYIKDIDSDNFLLIGPTFSFPLDAHSIRGFMKEHIISSKFFETMQKIFSSIPLMPFQQFIYILRFSHYQINHEKVSEDSLLNYLTPENNATNFYSQSKFYINAEDSTEISRSFDDAYETEQSILHYIETGNVNELRQLALNTDLPMPDIGITPMSQQKMSGILVITVIARFVIGNGMNVDTAMRLSHIYLQGIESAPGTKELTTLITNAYIDYSERLQALKIPAPTSPLVYSCIRFVPQTVNSPISVSDVAEHVGKVFPMYQLNSRLNLDLH